jgi:hypothetical protein
MAASGETRVVVTGHNRESTARVVHYLRPTSQATDAGMEFHGGVLVTDDQHIIADGTEFNVTTTATAIATATPVQA